MSITGYPTGPAASGATFNRQVFAASGTWTKPSGAQLVRVQLLSGGGGGGSGRRAATGGAGHSGGAGGGAGVYVEAWYNSVDLPSTVAVTVGTGGAGGAGVQVDSTDGNPGATGGESTFGTFMRAQTQNRAACGGDSNNDANPGVPGSYLKGVTSTFIAAPGAGGRVNSGPISDSAVGVGALAGSNPGGLQQYGVNLLPLVQQPPGGGAGGAIPSTNNAASTGGWGGNTGTMLDTTVQNPGSGSLSATGGSVAGVPSPKQLTDTLYGVIPAYGGAGGGPCAPVTGGSGGAGGSAQGYGAGGGGGGTSNNGSVSGTGGAGAPGLCIVTTWN